ncbi:MAG: DnaJ domain-containing protein [Chloroflexi bacterium]|nr:DnaJ domain-containing protein [Chloroflexota bacterium]
MKFIDYYAILNVPRNATLSDIRSSYRRLAFLYHPDITNNPESIQRTRR